MQRASRIQCAGFTAACLACIASIAHGGEAPESPRLEHEILPLFKARCQKCHGPVKPKGKLNLSSARSLARGGESGPVIVPGKLDESLVWEKVANGEMPPQPAEPCSSGEKAKLRRWIEQGAKGLPSARARVARARRGPTTGRSGLRPIPRRRRCTAAARVRTTIDRFIQRALEDRGLALGPDADRIGDDPALELRPHGAASHAGRNRRVCERS